MYVHVSAVHYFPVGYGSGEARLHWGAQPCGQRERFAHVAAKSGKGFRQVALGGLCLQVRTSVSACASPIVPSKRRSADTLSPFRVNTGAVLTASP